MRGDRSRISYPAARRSLTRKTKTEESNRDLGVAATHDLNPKIENAYQSIESIFKNFVDAHNDLVDHEFPSAKDRRTLYTALGDYNAAAGKLIHLLYRRLAPDEIEIALNHLYRLIRSAAFYGNASKRNMFEEDRDRDNGKKSRTTREAKTLARRVQLRPFLEKARTRSPNADEAALVTEMRKSATVKALGSRNTLVNDVKQMLKSVSDPAH